MTFYCGDDKIQEIQLNLHSSNILGDITGDETFDYNFRVLDFYFLSDSVKMTRPVILVEGYAGFHEGIQERLTIPAIRKTQ
jgi:hypothetical protein